MPILGLEVGAGEARSPCVTLVPRIVYGGVCIGWSRTAVDSVDSPVIV